MRHTAGHILKELKTLGKADVRATKEKFGIFPQRSLGIFLKDLKMLAKELPKSNLLACELFDTGQYEARLLVPMIFNPKDLTPCLMDRWAVNFSTWEECDTYCMGFFGKSSFAYEKAFEWAQKKTLYFKRAGFVCMVSHAFTNKIAPNEEFISFLPEIVRYSTDERLYVKKGINWALRQIGKRNIDLLKVARHTAKELSQSEDSNARWIGRDALKQLKGPSIHMKNYPKHSYQ